MFSNLSERLSRSIKQLTGQGRLTEKNIRETLREVRLALLEADVALPVVKTFMQTVQDKAIGETVMQSLTPGQALIKVVRDELVHLLGDSTTALSLHVQPPAIVLVAGLQGAGKTTTVAKLANLLQTNNKKKVMVVSTDIYRPAAIAQLKTLATQCAITCHPSDQSQTPSDIVNSAIMAAKHQVCDVLIIDTAGRLHIDDAMMNELKTLHALAQPVETLFVVDSMTGQDAVNTASAFDQALPLTGIVLTKTDGDARGGAALSIRHVTGKPIKFMGTGEKIDGIETFHPDRVASRILGMGDILGLIEQAEQSVDAQKAKKVATKMQKGGFDLEDFRDQLVQMNKMGGVSSLMKKLPGANQMPQDGLPDKEMKKTLAIIDSMTKKERRFPHVIKGSRKKRIAAGSGTQVQDINRLLKQFTQMQKMMKKLGKKGGMRKLMQSMQGMMRQGGGTFPPF